MAVTDETALRVTAPPPRTPPHSLPAEQAVLGGLMLRPQAWDQVADLLNEEDFYHARHRVIFRAIAALTHQLITPDYIAVSQWLSDHRELEQAGGGYLAELVENVAGATHTRDHAQLVHAMSTRRRLFDVGMRIADSAYDPDAMNIAAMLDRAEQGVFALADRQARRADSCLPLNHLLARAVDRIEELFHKKDPITGVATGFTDFDRLTAGLQNSDLVVIAGRPSMGKTALAVNIAEHAAIQDKLRVAIFSMEMSGQQLAMRMLASLARVNQQNMRTGQLNDEDWDRIGSTVSLIQDATIFIDDKPALSPNELSATCRRLAREHGGLDLVIVDYLQLMRVPSTEENRATEISEISRSLKALAKELQLPVLALSQLNRSVEQRTDKRPVMSDLRESGAIEQDADLIVFIYRDEVYHPETEHKGEAEIIVAKQRNGPIGTVTLAFLGHHTRFESYADDSRLASGGSHG